MGWNVADIILFSCAECGILMGMLPNGILIPDFETSHTLVLGQPAMAVMPLKLMNTKTGEILTPKTTPIPNDLVHYIELPCNVQITVPSA